MSNEKYKPVKHCMLKKQFDIVFLYKEKIESLSTGYNPLNNNLLYWFSDSTSMYITNKINLIKIVKNIRSKTEKIYYDTFNIFKGKNNHEA